MSLPKERQSSHAASVSLVEAALSAHEREGSRRYDVYLGDEGIGEVRRYRERYPYRNLGGNVAQFRSRWSWTHTHTSQSFDTRKEAVADLIRRTVRP